MSGVDDTLNYDHINDQFFIFVLLRRCSLLDWTAHLEVSDFNKLWNESEERMGSLSRIRKFSLCQKE